MLAVNITAKLPPQLAGRMVVIALGAGVLADGLLRVTPWGLNLSLAMAGLVIAGLVLVRWGRVELEGEGRWLVAPLLFFAAALAWRDSPTLTVANGLALLVAATLMALTARAGQLRRAGLTQYALGVAYVLGYAAVGLLPTLLGELAWRRWRWGWSDPLLAVGRGLVLAVPPLVVFGGLLVAADASFETLVRDVLAFDASDLVLHVLLVALYAWLIGGTLREMLLGPLRVSRDLDQPSRLRLGSVEVAVVLALLDGLFLAFVLVWFVATVLRDQRRRFAFGALLSAWLVIAGLDVLNPDALIVRTNAAYGHLEFGAPLQTGRAAASAAFEQRPLASLSADATPAIVEVLPQLSEAARQVVIERLLQRDGAEGSDWRTFNWSRAQAHQAVAGLHRD